MLPEEFRDIHAFKIRQILNAAHTQSVRLDKARTGQPYIYGAAGNSLIDNRQQVLIEFIQVFQAGGGKEIFPGELSVCRDISIFGGGTADVNGK